MGPLNGLKIIEIGGIGAGPFCGQMLGDMGAHVVRVDRKGQDRTIVSAKYDVLHRNRRSITLDLKKPEGIDTALRLIETSEVLIEGFRPGVMEKLGLGPELCFKRNPRLIYGRMSGWGQDGPLVQTAAHDINCLSLTGALHAIGRAGEKPVPPLNIIGDFGGGGLLLAFGIMCALYETQTSGHGQVVDAAMVDGAAALMGFYYGLWAAGVWTDERGTNRLDGGAHFYDTYETADGLWVSVGSVEPQFYGPLLELLGVDDPEFDDQMDRTKWPELKKKLEAVFLTKTRNEWCEIMEGKDVCFTPVLSYEEAIKHPHNKDRGTFVDVQGVMQPAPAPRFGRTSPGQPETAPDPGQHTDVILLEYGFKQTEIEALRDHEVI